MQLLKYSRNLSGAKRCFCVYEDRHGDLLLLNVFYNYWRALECYNRSRARFPQSDYLLIDRRLDLEQVTIIN